MQLEGSKAREAEVNERYQWKKTTFNHSENSRAPYKPFNKDIRIKLPEKSGFAIKNNYKIDGFIVIFICKPP